MISQQMMKEFLSAQDLANMLGVTAATIHNYVARTIATGESLVPDFIQVGSKKKVLFHIDDVEKWLNANRKQYLGSPLLLSPILRTRSRKQKN